MTNLKKFVLFIFIITIFCLSSCSVDNVATYRIVIETSDNENVIGFDATKAYESGIKVNDVLNNVTVTKEGYTFVGFSIDQKNKIPDDFIMPESDLKIYPLLQANTYSATLWAQNGVFSDSSSSKVVDVLFGQEFDPETPTSSNEFEDFENWYTDENYTTMWNGSIPAGNFSLYAKYKKASSSIKFNLSDDETTSSSEVSCLAGDKLVNALTDITCAKEGYTFLGWSLDGVNPVDSEYTVSKDGVTVKPLFQINQYTLSLVTGKDGSLSETQYTYNYKEVFTLPSPTVYDDYEKEFSGWYLDESFDTAYNYDYITKDTVLYAKYDYVGKYGFYEFTYQGTSLAKVYTKNDTLVRESLVPTDFYYEDYKSPNLLVVDWYDENGNYVDLATSKMNYENGETITLTPCIYSNYFTYRVLDEKQVVDGSEVSVPTNNVVLMGNNARFGKTDENDTLIKDESGNFFDSEFTVLYIPSRIKGYDVYEVASISAYTTTSTNDYFYTSSNYILKEVYIGSGVKSISSYAFSTSVNLESVYFEEGSQLEKVGTKTFYHCEKLANIALPDSVKEIGTEDVGDSDNGTFDGCTSLQNFTLPSSLEILGAYSFYNCNCLVNVVVPSTIKFIGRAAFKDAFAENGVLELNISDQNALYVETDGKKISSNALYKCNATEINIKGLSEVPSANVFELGKYTSYPFSVSIKESTSSSSDNYFYWEKYALGFFHLNTNLKKVTFDENIKSIGELAFYGCGDVQIIFPASVEEVSFGEACFACNSTVGEFTLPDVMTVVPAYCFANSQDITNFKNKNPFYEVVNEYAFSNCTSLTSFVISSWTTDIDSTSFYNCTGLLANPNGVTINENNKYFTKVTGENEVTRYILANGGQNIVFDFEGSVENKVFPDGLVEIPALYAGTSTDKNTIIKTITIPQSVKSIAEGAFKYCSELTTIIYKGVSQMESIGDSAFYECEKLQYAYYEASETIDKFVIPASVKYLGCDEKTYNSLVNDEFDVNAYNNPGSCFYHCYLIADVVFENETNIKYIGESCFDKGIKASFNSVEFPTNAATDGLIICSSAFYNKQNTATFDIPSYCTQFGNNAIYLWYGVSFPSNGLCTKINGQLQGIVNASLDIVIPSYITETGEKWLYKTTLKSITFEEGSNLKIINSLSDTTNKTTIKTIDFTNCKNVEEITGLNTFKKLTACNLILPATFFTESVVISASGGGSSSLTDCVVEIKTVLNLDGLPIEYKLNSLFSSSYVKNIIFGEGLVELGDNALASCSKLTVINLPNSLERIGNGAFKSTVLTSIVIPSNVNYIGESAFAKCTKLTSFVMPESITEISNDLFDGCSLLASVTINNQTTSIGDFAFYNCPKLAKVLLSDGTENLPSSLKYVGIYAFGKDTSLSGKTFTIGKDLTSVGYGAFNISGTTSVTATPYGLKFDFAEGASLEQLEEVGQHAFRNAIFTNKENGQSIYKVTYTLEKYPSSYSSSFVKNEYSDVVFSSYSGSSNEVIIEDGVTKIEANAFAFAENQCLVTFPSSLKLIEAGSSSYGSMKNVCGAIFTDLSSSDAELLIDNYAFMDCPLSQLEFPNVGLVSVDGYAFAAKTAKSTNVMTVKNLVIPSNVTLVASCVFKFQYNFTSITLSEGLQSIPESTFDVSGGSTAGGTSMVTEIVIPSTVEIINSYAFRGMESLSKITFAKNEQGETSVQSLGKQFIIGTKISEVEIPSSVTTLSTEVFSGSRFTTITIPTSVTEIGSSAFKNSANLTSIVIPSSVTTIGSNLFDGCSALQKVEFGDTENGCSLKTFPSKVFYNCSALETVIIYGDTFIEGNWYSATSHAFVNANTNCVVYVNDLLLEQYKTSAKWSQKVVNFAGLSTYGN